jgi:hypothetical protein
MGTASSKQKERYMEDVLFEEIFRGGEAALRQWIKENPEKVNQVDSHGMPLLHKAAALASPLFVAELVDEYGADVGKQAKIYEGNASGLGGTALHFASGAQTVSVLLQRDSDPSAVAFGGETPLYYYARCNNVGCVERLLLETKTLAYINKQETCDKYSALHVTFTHYTGGDEPTRAPVTILLLLAGANPRIEDEAGRTPLEMLEDSRIHRHDEASKSVLQEAVADGGRTFLLHKARHISDIYLPKHLRMPLCPPYVHASSCCLALNLHLTAMMRGKMQASVEQYCAMCCV